jgi:hypothetical protein
MRVLEAIYVLNFITRAGIAVQMRPHWSLVTIIVHQGETILSREEREGEVIFGEGEHTAL